MIEENGVPPDVSPLEEYKNKKENRDSLDKISKIVPNLRDETTVAEVAEDADVSKETARRYLSHFEDWNILIQAEENPEKYIKNESYFIWLRINTLSQEKSESELKEILSELAEKDQEFSEEFGVDSPKKASLLKNGYQCAGENAQQISSWHSIRERMDDIILALQKKWPSSSEQNCRELIKSCDNKYSKIINYKSSYFNEYLQKVLSSEFDSIKGDRLGLLILMEIDGSKSDKTEKENESANPGQD